MTYNQSLDAGDPGNLKKVLYHAEPDYERPLFKLSDEIRDHMHSRLSFLYDEDQAVMWMPELERIMKVHYAHKPLDMIEMEENYDPGERFTEKDLVLITYGDLIKGEGKSPLATLHKYVDAYNRGAINTLHILPFFPYSSDRGFAVVDYLRVDPKLGTWEDIKGMAGHYDLMFDGVLNHCSSRSMMFQRFLNGNPHFLNFFIHYDHPDDLTPDQRSKIFRPRTSDILTKFHTINGPRYVWTTFSPDQVDLNFRNPAVLMSVIEGLLFYVRHGADILRLDAVTYIWAEPGTECIHLPETHEIVKLLRDVVDAIAPGVAIITETNVPHEDNISYFGDGTDEAHMVYNFALPGLVLHTFFSENATAISNWAQGVADPSGQATFFNILDTHDGIGLMGVKHILTKQEIDFIIEQAKKRGAFISYKMSENRTEEPYEINTTWWSIINPLDSDEEMAFQVKRYLASRSISLVLQGVPALYMHGVAGSDNFYDLVKKTNQKRDINRGAIDGAALAGAFDDPNSKGSLIRKYGSRLHLIRTGHRAFHPQGQQHVFTINPDIFTVYRISPEGDRHILTMTNVTSRVCHIEVQVEDLDVGQTDWNDLMSGTIWKSENKRLSVTLQPYDVVWLTPVGEMQE